MISHLVAPTGLTTDVFLNIYHYNNWNSCLEPVGCGLYHTSVEVNGMEYEFIVMSSILHEPSIDTHPVGLGGYAPHSRLHMGTTRYSPQQIEDILRQLQFKYTNGHYHIFGNNCNNFCQYFVFLLTGRPIPTFIFRLTSCLNCCSCCLPQSFLNAQWALESYYRDRIERAQYYLPIGYRLKMDLKYPMNPQAVEIFNTVERSLP